MKFFGKIIKEFDVVGSKMEFTYQRSSRIKTLLGGLTSLIVAGLMLFCVYMFGIEIVQKTKPLILSGKVFDNDTYISIRENPIVFYPFGGDGNHLDFESHFELEIILMGAQIIDGILYQEITSGKSEPCDLDKHMPMQKNSILNGDISITYKDGFCMTPNYKRFDNGTVVTEEQYLYNTGGYIPNKHVHLRLKKCDPAANKKCNPSKFDDLKFFYLDVYYFSYNENLVDSITPYTLVSTGESYALGTSTSTSVVNFRGHSKLNTDHGLIFTDISTMDVVVFKKLSAAAISSNTDYFIDYILDGDTNLIMNQRSYKKFQSLIADLGGVLKVLLLGSELLLRAYSKSIFFSQLINDNFSLPAEENKVGNKVINASGLIKLNNYANKLDNSQSIDIHEKIPKVNQVRCNVGFKVYLQSYFCSSKGSKNSIFISIFENFFDYEIFMRKLIEVHLMKQLWAQASIEHSLFESLIDFEDFNKKYPTKNCSELQDLNLNPKNIQIPNN